MEQKFLAAFAANREMAEKLGVRMRPITHIADAHRILSSGRTGDGFGPLADKNRLDLSLEALVVDKRYTMLFSDDEANYALSRLLDAGYLF